MARSDAKVSLCLWFDGRAEEAAEFYVQTFRACGQEASRDDVMRHGEAGSGSKGSALSATVTLAGQRIIALNGGPHFTFTPALSLFVTCADQAEIDAFWTRLCDGGAPSRCGWLTDRFGVSWQIVPAALGPMLGAGGPASERTMRALLTMTKLDLPALQAAYDGAAAPHAGEP